MLFTFNIFESKLESIEVVFKIEIKFKCPSDVMSVCGKKQL